MQARTRPEGDADSESASPAPRPRVRTVTGVADASAPPEWSGWQASCSDLDAERIAASRYLSLRHEDGRATAVIALVEQARTVRELGGEIDDLSAACRVAVEGLDCGTIRFVVTAGDGLAVLRSALDLVDALLYDSSEWREGRLFDPLGDT